MTEELKKILKKPRRQCVEMYDYFGNLVELNDTILIVQNGTLTPGIVISSTEKGITISAEKEQVNIQIGKVNLTIALM